MNLLFDTQVLVWLLTGDGRLRKTWIEALGDSSNAGFVSAIVAWEYSDLRKRGRLPAQEDMASIQTLYGLTLLDFPAECWSLVAKLPDIHRDPIDRMLVAHALALDMTLVTADASLRQYPVRTLW